MAEQTNVQTEQNDKPSADQLAALMQVKAPTVKESRSLRFRNSRQRKAKPAKGLVQSQAYLLWVVNFLLDKGLAGLTGLV